MPSILFINRVYPPAKGATGDMLQGMAEALAERGWEVAVLTTAEPGEPKTSTRRGVRILRAGGVLSRRNVLLRAASYVFMIPWLMTRALLLPRTDFVVTMTDPPMLVVLGLAMKFFKRNRVIHWAQDLYPEVAEELGVLPRGNAIANLLRRLSTEALVRGDAVVAIGRCMASRLTARGVSYAKISIIPNWAPPIQPLDRASNPFRSRHGLEGQFVVAYSGNMGSPMSSTRCSTRRKNFADGGSFFSSSATAPAVSRSRPPRVCAGSRTSVSFPRSPPTSSLRASRRLMPTW